MGKRDVFSEMPMKSSIEQIRQRFDNDVERFSNLDTGQSSTVDSSLAMNLIAQAAVAINPNAVSLLDVGCGAGNYTLTVLKSLPHLNITLIDLSKPMLERAVERVSQVGSGKITSLQGDIRELSLGEFEFDIILAAAVLHHLRKEVEWEAVFTKFFLALKPGGSLWIFDMVEHSTSPIQAVMWERYGEYLTHLKDKEYRDHVFAYIQKEDTPRSLLFQIDLLRDVGFSEVEILHKNNCFVAFGGIKRENQKAKA